MSDGEAVNSLSSKLCVLITRPMNSAKKTSADVTALGAKALISPTIDIKGCAFELPDLLDFDAFLFTSANSVRIFAENSDFRAVKVFCVGENTAHEAKVCGFNDVFAADGSASALFNLILQEKPKKALYLSPKEPSFPLVAELRRAGISCDAIITYESVMPDSLSFEAVDAIKNGKIEYALFYSKKSAENFITLAGQVDALNSLKSIKALCLSDGVVQSIQPELWDECCVCTHTHGSGMMDLLAHKLTENTSNKV